MSKSGRTGIDSTIALTCFNLSDLGLWRNMFGDKKGSNLESIKLRYYAKVL